MRFSTVETTTTDSTADTSPSVRPRARHHHCWSPSVPLSLCEYACASAFNLNVRCANKTALHCAVSSFSFSFHFSGPRGVTDIGLRTHSTRVIRGELSLEPASGLSANRNTRPIL